MKGGGGRGRMMTRDNTLKPPKKQNTFSRMDASNSKPKEI